MAKAMNAAATDERFAAILIGIHFISLNPGAKPIGFSIVIMRSFPLGAAPLRGACLTVACDAFCGRTQR
jgi:hypothetical protein